MKAITMAIIVAQEWECNQDHPTKIKLANQG
jgi:hypothetical protein